MKKAHPLKLRRRRAVFLDRDGVINKDVHHLNKVADLKLLRGSTEAIKALNRMEYLVVVISNQAAVAKGMLTLEGLDEIHAVLIQRLGARGATVDAIYYCPHHPEGTVKKHAIRCTCRKPNPGMILKALKKFAIDPKKSFMIGDTTSDILAGKRAKLRTILVKTGYGGRDRKHEVEPDFVVRNLAAAVEVVKKSR